MFLNMNLKMFLHIDMAFIAYLNQLFIISYVITPFLPLLKIIIQIYDICNERSHEIVTFTKMEVQPATNYLSVFDHFVGLALKGITYWSSVQIYHTFLLDIGWYNIRRQKYECHEIELNIISGGVVTHYFRKKSILDILQGSEYASV